MYYSTTNATTIWGYWTNSTTATTSAATTTDPWTIWVTTEGTGTGSITTNNYTVTLWHQWNTNFHKDVVRSVMAPRKAMTREEREAYDKKLLAEQALREKQRLEYEAKLAEQRRLRLIAEEKAKTLMLNYLTQEQREEYERHQRFHVISKEGNLYRINKGSHGNIQLVKDNQVVESLCVQPKGQMPCYDAMLAQKLWLETDEQEIRKVANITNYRRQGFVRAG